MRRQPQQQIGSRRRNGGARGTSCGAARSADRGVAAKGGRGFVSISPCSTPAAANGSTRPEWNDDVHAPPTFNRWRKNELDGRAAFARTGLLGIDVPPTGAETSPSGRAASTNVLMDAAALAAAGPAPLLRPRSAQRRTTGFLGGTLHQRVEPAIVPKNEWSRLTTLQGGESHLSRLRGARARSRSPGSRDILKEGVGSTRWTSSPRYQHVSGSSFSGFEKPDDVGFARAARYQKESASSETLAVNDPMLIRTVNVPQERWCTTQSRKQEAAQSQVSQVSFGHEKATTQMQMQTQVNLQAPSQVQMLAQDAQAQAPPQAQAQEPCLHPEVSEGWAVLLPHPSESCEYGTTVVLLPQGLTLPAGDLAQNFALHIPSGNVPNPESQHRFSAVSQRLGALLGFNLATQDLSSKLQPIKANASRRHPVLRRSKAEVLSQVGTLTDAVWDHILQDTVVAMNRCSDAPSGVATLTKPVFLDVGIAEASERSAIDDEWRLCGKAVRADLVAQQAAFDARLDLQRLETELQWKYSEHAQLSGERPIVIRGTAVDDVMKIDYDDCIHGALWQQDLQLDYPVVTVNALQEFNPALPEVAELKSTPAALPSERARHIERYRADFAHHCKATREAGLAVAHTGPGPPGDVSTATWIVWPFLADCIAKELFDQVAEEMHDAMAAQIDEMIRCETGVG